jgi:hypothetical protein
MFSPETAIPKAGSRAALSFAADDYGKRGESLSNFGAINAASECKRGGANRPGCKSLKMGKFALSTKVAGLTGVRTGPTVLKDAIL